MDANDEMAERLPRKATAISALRPYAETLTMVAAVTLMGMLVAPRWGTSSVDLLYLPAVLGAAFFYGFGPGAFAAVASALAFNFYFTRPIHTLRIANAEDVATVALLFLVALVTSQLAARMRREAEAARSNAERNATIAGLARRLLSCSSSEQAAGVACQELARLFDCNAIMLGNAPEPSLIAAWPSHATPAPSDLVAAIWAIESGLPAGRGTLAIGAAEWAFYPVRSAATVLGALGLARDDGSSAVDPDRITLLESLVDQVALALERSRLESETQEFARVRENDRIRSVLLSSIGQDLEPRLAAIATGVRALQRNESDHKPFISAIGGEVYKLQQYLANMLELGPESDRKAVNAGTVSIDLFNRTVSKDGVPVHLAPKEYAILAELAKHPGRVLTHGHLLRAAWGPAQERQIEYLRVAVRSLRQKLEQNPAQPTIILNEPAVGYRLVG
ncbi:MAG: DUF4118 domain-containing protein [Pseudomonadota bacterium]